MSENRCQNIESPAGILRGAQWLWRACLFLPFVYILIAWGVERVWFSDGQPFGFWPMRAQSFRRVLAVLVLLALGCQIALLLLRRVYGGRIRTSRLIPLEAARLYWKRTVRLVICSDLVCGLGLVSYLMAGQWPPLLAFCGASYLLYLQAYPNGRFLDDAGR